MLAARICAFICLLGTGEGIPDLHLASLMAGGRTIPVLEYDADGSCDFQHNENITLFNHTQLTVCVHTRIQWNSWYLPIISFSNEDHDDKLSIALYPELQILDFSCCGGFFSELFFNISLFVWQHWCVSVNLETRFIKLSQNGQVLLGNITTYDEDALLQEVAVDGADMVVFGPDMCPQDDDPEIQEMNFIGQMADARLYDLELTDDEMINFTNCESDDLPAPLMTLHNNDFRIFGPAVLASVSYEEVCSASHTVLFSRHLTFKEAVEWCSQLNGSLAIPEIFFASDEFCLHDDLYQYWVGVVRNDSSNNWMRFSDKEPFEEPLGSFIFSFHRMSKVHKCLSFTGFFFEPNDCNLRLCVSCNFTSPVRLRIWGLCEDSLFDHTLIAHDFKNYQMMFHGDRHSRLSRVNNTWMMTSRRHKKLRAIMHTSDPSDIPLGRHTWSISEDTCGYRQAVLVLTACHDDQYTCNDGSCIDHHRRCNLVLDCPDHSDELQCSILSRQMIYSDQHPPPSETPGPLPLNISVNITSIRDFSLQAFTISIDASLTIKWRDLRLRYKNLQNLSYANKLKDGENVWIPKFEVKDERLGTVDIKHPTRDVFVIREAGPLTGEEVELETEDSVYSGSENTLMLLEKQTITFLCHFNLQKFPFDVQRCSLVIMIHDLQTKFGVMVKEDVGVFFEGERRLLEYYLAAESMAPYAVSHATYMKVEFQFHHLYGYYIGNVFVPSFLLVVVCFLVLYFDIKDFPKRLHQALEDIEAIQCVANDVLVYDHKLLDSIVLKPLDRAPKRLQAIFIRALAFDTEIDRLYDTTAEPVVTKVKAHHARDGIPDEIINDNGPQMVSETVSKFTSRWGISQKTISLYNSKVVKSTKNMLRKTEHNGEDQYLALLNFRNTATQGTTTSPVQRMMLGDKRWKKGTVTKQLDDWSYEVETEDGGIVQRNMCHMRHSYESPVRIIRGDPVTDVAEGRPEQLVVSGEHMASGDANLKEEDLHNYVQKHEYLISTPVMNDTVLKTRSGRCVKPPKVL
ncbi:uncharacterized protein [Panulirus ornatus]|uniref:uncharacterized protein n=1 Tax=Panulirus ornatus TaxID=150431 RepID=UPI003A8BF251